LQKGPVPKIYVATGAAELLVIDGTPNYTPLQGTNLLYVSNTTGQIFKRTVDQKTYVLLSGRWYAAPPAAGSVVDASAAGGVEAHGWRVGAERQDPAGQHGRQHATLRRS
jgi:hypothetical protein